MGKQELPRRNGAKNVACYTARVKQSLGNQWCVCPGLYFAPKREMYSTTQNSRLKGIRQKIFQGNGLNNTRSGLRGLGYAKTRDVSFGKIEADLTKSDIRMTLWGC